MCLRRYRILEKPATNILSNVSKEKRCARTLLSALSTLEYP